jgi:hypothetical protein
MAFTSQKAAEAARALKKAAEVVIEHGSPERAERLRTKFGPLQLGNDLNRRGALLAELFAGLGEAVESLSARVEELEASLATREARPQRQVPSGGKK